MGSRQIDQFKSHTHWLNAGVANVVGNGGYPVPYASGTAFGTTASGGAETRPLNAAYAPRLHV